MAWPPSLTLDVWRRIWQGQQIQALPGLPIALVLPATEIGFPGVSQTVSNSLGGVQGAFALEPTGNSLEEGIYEFVYSWGYFAGAAADQVMTVNLFIDDNNQRPIWNLRLVLVSGTRVDYRVTMAVRQGYRARTNNQTATFAVGTFMVAALSTTPVLS